MWHEMLGCLILRILAFWNLTLTGEDADNYTLTAIRRSSGRGGPTGGHAKGLAAMTSDALGNCRFRFQT